jgi:hypothetical protein
MFYLIAKNCTHWDAGKNRRYRLVRFECDKWNDTRRSKGAIWDAQERTWGEFSRIEQKGHWVFTREAIAKEIAETQQGELKV